MIMSHSQQQSNLVCACMYIYVCVTVNKNFTIMEILLLILQPIWQLLYLHILKFLPVADPSSLNTVTVTLVVDGLLRINTS